MNQHNHAPSTNQRDHALRDQLMALKARYDYGAVPPAIFAVMVELERDLAWHEHQTAMCGRPA